MAQAWNEYTFKNNTFTGKVANKWNERWWNHRLLRKSGANPELLFAVFNVKRGSHF